MPYLVGSRYPESRVVVFSSGNPYPHTPTDGRGASEETPLSPIGVYGWSIVARESSFATTAQISPGQKVSLVRLMYAQHLCYGVVRDLAEMVLAGKPVSLQMPAVNLISQRDANVAAARALTLCANPPRVLNLAGPVVQVRDLVQRLATELGRTAIIADDEGADALLADDSHWYEQLGPYRDGVDEMIAAICAWVAEGCQSWNKPSHFGSATHSY